MEEFVPDMYQKSIYHIDYDKLQEDGIKCLLFDLDNTCVPYRDKEPNKKLVELFETLKDMGIKPFKRVLNVDCQAKAGKPGKRNFLKILKLFNYQLSDVAIIGDQLYKDVLGGNRVGIRTILVNPMSKDDMIFTTLIFRPLERRMFKKLSHKGLFIRGKYYE